MSRCPICKRTGTEKAWRSECCYDRDECVSHAYRALNQRTARQLQRATKSLLFWGPILGIVFVVLAVVDCVRGR